MGFLATVHCRLTREMTTPDENGESASTQKENITGLYEGSVSVQNGIVFLRYEGPDGFGCTVSFSKADPGIITLCQRFGEEADTMTLVLEEGRRHICINKTSETQLEITACGHHIRNNIRKNGKLLLVYTTELHGFCVEKTTMALSIHKIEK